MLKKLESQTYWRRSDIEVEIVAWLGSDARSWRTRTPFMSLGNEWSHDQLLDGLGVGLRWQNEIG